MIDIFKQIIIRNQERIQNVDLIERMVSYDPGANYVIVGPRRAGKTYFLYQLIQKHYFQDRFNRVLYMNFEDERLLEMTSNDLALIIDAYQELYDLKPVIFFDEIQNMISWEIFCRRLVDEGYQVYVTGSNAKMLSTEVASTLGGRFLIKEILPLSFLEYLKFQGLEINKHLQYSAKMPLIKRLFNDYLKYGGFPELMKYSDKRDYLNNLFKKVFYGDILIRYNLKNKQALALLVKKVAENVKDETSYNRMKNIIKSIGIQIGTNTIIDYLSYLKESYLIYSISNTVNKFSDKEMKKKYYFTDVGIMNLFLFEDYGRLLENLVFNELYRRYKDRIYFYRRRIEVDFFIPDEQLMIQVVYNISNAETRIREINTLWTGMKDMDVKKGLILTQSTSLETLKDGTRHIEIKPVYEWLLGLQSANKFGQDNP